MKPNLGMTAAIAALALACAPANDTEEMVEQTLEQSSIHGVHVRVERDPPVVHLSGTVEALADRARAEELAAAVVGTSGRVRNEIQVEGLGPLGTTGR